MSNILNSQPKINFIIIIIQIIIKLTIIIIIIIIIIVFIYYSPQLEVLRPIHPALVSSHVAHVLPYTTLVYVHTIVD